MTGTSIVENLKNFLIILNNLGLHENIRYVLEDEKEFTCQTQIKNRFSAY